VLYKTFIICDKHAFFFVAVFVEEKVKPVEMSKNIHHLKKHESESE
jgi:hypothetical protein